MAINITEKYLPIMIEAFKKASITEGLLKNQTVVAAAKGAKTFKYPVSVFGGYAPYNKNGSNAAASFDISWKDATFTQDRFAKIVIDAVENEETMDVALKTAFGQALKGAVDEVDAYRFYTLAKNAGTIDNTVVDANNIITIVNNGIQSVINGEGSADVIVINTKHYGKILSSTELQKVFNIQTNTGAIDTRVASYNGIPVVFANSKLMKKTLSLSAGSYFANNATAKDINVIVADMSAFLAAVKVSIDRVFAPSSELAVEYGADGVYQDAVAWCIESRIYHDAWDIETMEGKIFANVDAE